MDETDTACGRDVAGGFGLGYNIRAVHMRLLRSGFEMRRDQNRFPLVVFRAFVQGLTFLRSVIDDVNQGGSNPLKNKTSLMAVQMLGTPGIRT